MSLFSTFIFFQLVIAICALHMNVYTLNVIPALAVKSNKPLLLHVASSVILFVRVRLLLQIEADVV